MTNPNAVLSQHLINKLFLITKQASEGTLLTLSEHEGFRKEINETFEAGDYPGFEGNIKKELSPSLLMNVFDQTFNALFTQKFQYDEQIPLDVRVKWRNTLLYRFDEIIIVETKESDH